MRIKLKEATFIILIDCYNFSTIYFMNCSVYIQQVPALQLELSFTSFLTCRSPSLAPTVDTQKCLPEPSLVYRWCPTWRWELDARLWHSLKAQVSWFILP